MNNRRFKVIFTNNQIRIFSQHEKRLVNNVYKAPLLTIDLISGYDFEVKETFVELLYHSDTSYGTQVTVFADQITGFLLVGNVHLLLLTIESEQVVHLNPDCSPLVCTSEENYDAALKQAQQVYPSRRAIEVIKKLLAVPFCVKPNEYVTERIYKSESDVYAMFNFDNILWNRIISIERMFQEGTFFYSYDVDLTRNLQEKYNVYKEKKQIDVPLNLTESVFNEPLRSSTNTCTDISVLFELDETFTKTTDNDQCSTSDSHNYIKTDLFSYARKDYVWNLNLLYPKVNKAWFCPVIQGSISQSVLNSGNSFIQMILIARRSWRLGGTRFFARGIDDKGNVANFVESEFLFRVHKTNGKNIFTEAMPCDVLSGGYFSFVIVRGSVPCYWTQNSKMIFSNPTLDRTKKENLSAYKQHFIKLKRNYGCIYFIDLLSRNKTHETNLAAYFRSLIESALDNDHIKNDTNESNNSVQISNCDYRYFSWDFHFEVKTNGFIDSLKRFIQYNKVSELIDEIGYFHTIGPKFQRGVFRVNCLDCLDRTNIVLWVFCQLFLFKQLQRSSHYELLFLRGNRQNRSSININSSESFIFNKYSKEPWNINDEEKAYYPLPVCAFKPYNCELFEELLLFFVAACSSYRLNITSYTRTKQPIDVDDVSIFIWLLERNNTFEKLFDKKFSSPSHVDFTKQQTSTFLLKEALCIMWADQGDLISLAYTGTGSVFTPMLRAGKSTLLTSIAHFKRSAARIYNQTFEDNYRQETIDLILKRKADSVSQSIIDKELVSRPLNFYICTWNMGGYTGSDSSIFKVLVPNLDQSNADIYIFCFQEIVNINSVSNNILGHLNNNRETEIISVLQSILADRAKLLFYKRLIGILLVIYVSPSLYNNVSCIHGGDIKMGLMNQLGNKGAVSISFKLFNISYLFACLHLAPDKNGDKLKERISQINKIHKEFELSKYDYYFLAGDFNFPAMATMEEVRVWLHEKNFNDYFQRDQLSWVLNSQSSNMARLYNEAKLSFWPTYKYKVNQNVYDKTRCPSWCDRVLYGGKKLLLKAGTTAPTKYLRIRGIVVSDHKPVYLLCSVTNHF